MKAIILILSAFISALAVAHPTSYEGGYSLMTEMHPEMQEISMIYSPKFWLGTGVISLRSPERFELVTSQVGWLVNRWNLEDAQGNFYLLGGVGMGNVIEDNGDSGPRGGIYRMGAQFDFETRRFYSFFKFAEHRFFEDNQFLSRQMSAAVGFAPYLARFDELNSWVIFKVTAMNDFQDHIYLPMARFFYKNFLWEVGQDFRGQSQFNFMVRF